MSDEEVIRRRLLIDGDGTGDDRRLNNLLKSIIKWSNATEQNQSDNELMYDRLLSQLGQCEFSARRSRILTRTNEKQLTNYKTLQSKLERKIKDVKATIEKNKLNLDEAKILKRNRMQYDLLAQSIKEQPARSDTDKKLSSLRAELNELKEESLAIDQKLDTRRKQFYVLVSSANQLRAMLEEGSNGDEGMNTSLDDITNSPGPEPMSE